MSEERQKNLERWEKLAPRECYLQRYGTSTTPYWVVKGVVLDRVNVNLDYYVLGALIESITARGWDYAIESDIPRVTASVFANDPNYAIAHAGQPADALLSAYLQAIEAKENS